MLITLPASVLPSPDRADKIVAQVSRTASNFARAEIFCAREVNMQLGENKPNNEDCYMWLRLQSV